ncbi:MAG: hypothetical protein HY706_11210 [Candidatus Hydrogenedentes bacterium]|nr:hypothetical protein [Candidatus Hydrogenedentota bacterium]
MKMRILKICAIRLRTVVLVTGLVLTATTVAGERAPWPQYEANPFVIRMDIPPPEESPGGIVTADLDGDHLLDYLVTVPGHVAAYGHDGRTLWVHDVAVRIGTSAEGAGLPGHHGPGVTAADINGNGRTEVLYLTQDSTLHVVHGATGEILWTARPPVPKGAERWEHLIVGNFRGKGDRDLLLQATNAEGYRMGRYLAAYALDRLRKGNWEPLWQRDDFISCAHNGARIADLDGDGRDEVLGGTIIGPDGALHYRASVEGHLDSIFVADVRPDVKGLEVVALEEGGNHVFLYNATQLLWETDHQRWEPQNAAVGEFDLERPGLEIWCRSRFDTHQKPFVFDAHGKFHSGYEMDRVAPEGWTEKGVEVIWSIHWTGEPKQLAAAKERHESGDVGVFDPIGGAFVECWPEMADRLYVADVSGDWREELVVLSGRDLHIYHNPTPNPRPDQPRLWTQPHYRRSKMTWNYYSP